MKTKQEIKEYLVRNKNEQRRRRDKMWELNSDKMRTTNITINYGLASFIGSVKRVAEENAKAISFNSFHAEDKGAVGMKFYCKKCNKETTKQDLVKGYKVGNEYAYFTEDELKQKFQETEGLTIIGTTRQPIHEQQVKAVYTIEPSPDKKTAVNNNVMYEVFRQYLIDNNNKLVGLMKLTSRGIKKGRDLAVISYNQELNRLVVTTLYYAEEIPKQEQFVDKQLDGTMLQRASAKLFGDIQEISISEITEQHTDKILADVEQKLKEPQKIELAKTEIKPIQKEEELLAKLIA
jgi:non-homologous end joining protein Ku